MRRAAGFTQRVALGFTLVELLIVLVIFGLVIGLVGGVGVERMQRARAQEEWLSLQRLARGLAFRAYSEGREVELRGDGAQLAWRMTGGQAGRPGEGAERVMPLAYWFVAPSRTVHINSHGIAEPARLVVTHDGVSRTLELNAWLEEDRRATP